MNVKDWVSKTDSDVCGVVTKVTEKTVHVRWIGNSRAEVVPKRNLYCCTPRAIVLEGNLDDEDLLSSRTEERYLRSFLEINGINLAYKNIHQISDLIVLKNAIKQEKSPFVQISCHGAHNQRSRAFIVFHKEEIFLNDKETQNVFREVFSGENIFFSACLLGKYKEEMEIFKESTGILKIAAFTREVFDSEAIMFEMMLYHDIYFNGRKFESAVQKSLEGMKLMNITGDRGQPLVRVF